MPLGLSKFGDETLNTQQRNISSRNGKQSLAPATLMSGLDKLNKTFKYTHRHLSQCYDILLIQKTVIGVIDNVYYH